MFADGDVMRVIFCQSCQSFVKTCIAQVAPWTDDIRNDLYVQVKRHRSLAYIIAEEVFLEVFSHPVCA